MEQLRIDFAMNNGHEMIIDRKDGIFRSELDVLEMNMLRAHRIPYLLHMDWVEVDGIVTFRYRLSGLKMLVHKLQQQPLTMEQYYILILGVIDALIECRDYMLRPEGCILNDQFIFIGEQLHEVKLAYIPLKRTDESKIYGGGELLSLIVRWTSFVEHIDGQGLKRILHYFHGKRWPLIELREELLGLIGGESLLHRRSNDYSESKIAQLSDQSLESIDKELPDRVKKNQGDDSVLSLTSHASKYFVPLEKNSSESSLADRIAEDLPFVEEEEEGAWAGKKKWVISCALLIAIACVWKFIYLAEPARQSLFISAAITMIFAAGFIFVWRNKAKEYADAVDSQMSSGLFEPQSEPLRQNGMWNAAPILSVESSGGASSISGKPFSQAPLHVAAEPTALLSRSEGPLEGNMQELWLCRTWQDAEARIEINDATSYIIGRSGDKVNYSDLADGVSRMHLEICKDKEEYYAKDLGSSNGSLMNGVMMIPYKKYRIAIGDVIQLAGEQGPMYELKRG